MMQSQKKRYGMIDGIRGIAIVNMVIFHFLYDVFIIYGKSPAWYGLVPVHVWQQAICWTFILISGFVWQWGKEKNLKRGIILNVCGFLITTVTYILIPEEAVWFGILNFIGCAVLFMIPLQHVLQKIVPGFGAVTCFLLFLLFKNVQNGYLGIGQLELVRLPKALYEIKVLTPFGFPFPGFVSSDYFPVFPWIFLYLTGFFLSRCFMRHSAWQKIAEIKIPFLSVIGQKSIWIYMLHQPVSMLICML